jgi:hypothetical protein
VPKRQHLLLVGRVAVRLNRQLLSIAPRHVLHLSRDESGGKLTVVEGQWQHPRTVIIEFPARDSAEAWYKSGEYQKIIDLRLKSTSGNLVILDGV